MTAAFYKVEREVKGFDEKLEKFKDELFAFCEQLGYKTKSYVYSNGHNRHFVKFTIKNEKIRERLKNLEKDFADGI